jgi:hypothetical protein
MKSCRQRRTGWTGASLLALALALAVSFPLAAQDWSGSIGVGVIAQDDDGSVDSFRTQSDLDEGLILEELKLVYDGGDESDTEMTLRAWGFGGAEPASHARFDLALDSPWRFDLDYDRFDSFFALTGGDLALRADDWTLERWHGGIAWDGWRKARLSLDLRYHERSGRVVRPLYGLNELYPLYLDLDETMAEAALRVETKELPVHFVLEQAYAVYERNNDRRPADPENLAGGDPDLFTDAAEDLDEERDVPTTRLLADWAGERAEVAVSMLYRPAELESTGAVSSTFDLQGGSIGRVSFIDDLTAKAESDAFVGNLRLGFHLAPGWTLRLTGDYRDTSTDATLVGLTLFRIFNPAFGTVDIGGEVDESTIFDVTEDEYRLTLEWAGAGGWTAWGGGSTGSRDVKWRFAENRSDYDVNRDSDGWLAGLGYRHGGVTASAEYQHGTFDSYVFRTDAETVDRLSLRFSSQLGGGWSVRLQGRFEDADNPTDVASLDRSSESYGGGFAWDSEDGESGFGLDLDLADLSSDVAIALPGGAPALSTYDLSLVSVAVHGRTTVGPVRLSGSAVRSEDSGDTWPLESIVARGRVAFDVFTGTEAALFGEYWSYDEDRADADDFDVLRYGVALAWRLP